MTVRAMRLRQGADAAESPKPSGPSPQRLVGIPMPRPRDDRSTPARSVGDHGHGTSIGPGYSRCASVFASMIPPATPPMSTFPHARPPRAGLAEVRPARRGVPPRAPAARAGDLVGVVEVSACVRAGRAQRIVALLDHHVAGRRDFTAFLPVRERAFDPSGAGLGRSHRDHRPFGLPMLARLPPSPTVAAAMATARPTGFLVCMVSPLPASPPFPRPLASAAPAWCGRSGAASGAGRQWQGRSPLTVTRTPLLVSGQ